MRCRADEPAGDARRLLTARGGVSRCAEHCGYDQQGGGSSRGRNPLRTPPAPWAPVLPHTADLVSLSMSWTDRPLVAEVSLPAACSAAISSLSGLKWAARSQAARASRARCSPTTDRAESLQSNLSLLERASIDEARRRGGGAGLTTPDCRRERHRARPEARHDATSADAGTNSGRGRGTRWKARSRTTTAGLPV